MRLFNNSNRGRLLNGELINGTSLKEINCAEKRFVEFIFVIRLFQKNFAGFIFTIDSYQGTNLSSRVPCLSEISTCHCQHQKDRKYGRQGTK